MFKYIGRRLLHLIPVIILISMLIFTIIKLTPGDPVGANLDPRSTARAEERQKGPD